MALRTGISPSAWAEEGERAIVTAVALLNEAQGEGRPAGAQMTG